MVSSVNSHSAAQLSWTELTDTSFATVANLLKNKFVILRPLRLRVFNEFLRGETH